MKYRVRHEDTLVDIEADNLHFMEGQTQGYTKIRFSAGGGTVAMFAGATLAVWEIDREENMQDRYGYGPTFQAGTAVEELIGTDAVGDVFHEDYDELPKMSLADRLDDDRDSIDR